MIKKWKQFNELYIQSPDVKRVNDTIDFSVLTKLEDERNSLVEGDEVLATYFSGGFDTYQFKLEKWFDKSENSHVLGTSYSDRVLTIEHAYHIVKKETYDDFIGPVMEKAAPRKKYVIENKKDPGVLYESTEIEEKVAKRYVSVIDDLFMELHEEFKTASGDADFTTDNLIEDYTGTSGMNIVETTSRQIIQNMNLSSVKHLKSDKIDISSLCELNNEWKTIHEGDDVIAIIRGMGNINRKYLIRVVQGNITKTHENDYCIKTELDMFHVDDALLLVKKETYEDFIGRLNI